MISRALTTSSAPAALDPFTLRAVLFDMDGTLYPQTPLRLLMAAELALQGLRTGSVAKASRLARILATFRTVREELRSAGEPRGEWLEQLQYTRTGDRLGVPEAEVRRVVEEWVMQRPLKHLRRLVPARLTALLDALASRHVHLGVLSDYPATTKLQAMQIEARFSLSLSTADPSINAFKPHPKGFWHACDMWGVAPKEVLYVGDRPEIDGAGAAAAGIRCFILTRRSGGVASGSLADLQRALAL